MWQISYDDSPTLYLVPTPIGNLDDMTYRSINILNTVEVIFSEDTRVTLQLLNHFDIKKPMISCRAQNEKYAGEKIISLLKDGHDIAYASDAGTPGISDPGFLVVRECVRQGIEVECLPGPTAAIPALVVSGIPCDRFVFEGFLPQKKGRSTRIASLAEEKRSMVFYESPYRVLKTLEQLMAVLGSHRQVAVCRELTKVHEEIVRGTLEEVVSHFRTHAPRGEFVIVVEGSTSSEKGKMHHSLDDAE